MKIIQKTEHLLKLNNLGEMIYSAISPTVWVMGFSGLPLFAMFVIMASAGVERVSCNKIEPKVATCELSRSSFMGFNKGEVASIEQVEEARFETRDTTDSDGKTMTLYNVFLLTKDEKILLANNSAEDAISFNEYMETSIGAFVIEADNRLSGLGIMLVLSLFLVIGLGVFSGVLRCLIFASYIFDKNENTLTIKEKGIWVNEVVKRALSDISEVKLETTHGENGMLYEVCLLMNEGDSLSLGGSSNQKEQHKIADWIRGYLDGRSH